MKPITAAIAAAALSCLTFAQAAEPTLQAAEGVGYQINLGTRNRIYLSRVGTVPLSAECIESMPALDAYVLKDRMQVTLDAGRTSRPNQIFAKCKPVAPTCTTSKPDRVERSQECPQGTVGAWTQSLNYVAADYPTCWAPGEWLPASPPAGACVAPNRAPTISGTPAATGVVGVLYSFTPTASDPDGDPLTFAIDNRPPWATFSTTTGKLSGTPTEPGIRSELRIRVGDGRGGEAMLQFPKLTILAAPGGAVTLSWTPPTKNTDGTSLTDLAGYKILYGISASALTQTITVTNPGVSSYIVDRLSPATWYFALRSVNSAGAESALSSIASKTIP